MKPICTVEKQAQMRKKKIDISFVAITTAPRQQLFDFLVVRYPKKANHILAAHATMLRTSTNHRE